MVVCVCVCVCMCVRVCVSVCMYVCVCVCVVGEGEGSGWRQGSVGIKSDFGSILCLPNHRHISNSILQQILLDYDTYSILWQTERTNVSQNYHACSQMQDF